MEGCLIFIAMVLPAVLGGGALNPDIMRARIEVSRYSFLVKCAVVTSIIFLNYSSTAQI